ncbi:MAG: hypothetical protein R3211_02790 [Balneolaceae bacterium]|nr:hypothetical protein [Balneolaceae bacterium]
MRCLREIAGEYSTQLEMEEFDVRGKNELPDHRFDIYLSSGGPGNPTDTNNAWIKEYHALIDHLWQHNLENQLPRKYAFFICHSFQLVTNYFNLGEVTRRKRTSFGIYPIHKTKAGKNDILLDGLPDPYYAVDNRDWQLVQPNLDVFEEHGAKILSIEKIRTNVEMERAIMAVRFSDEFVGTQYHPEADAAGMKTHFMKQENREKVIKNFGEEKYNNMIDHLDDPDKIELTHRMVIPSFLERALSRLNNQAKETSAA